jgi:hypothetical protein
VSADDRHLTRTEGVDDAHDAEAWRNVGAFMTRSRVEDVRFRLQEVLYDVDKKIEDGEALTREDIRALRQAKDELQMLTEDHLAHLADDVEPWDGGAGDMVPYGVMRRHLEDDDFPRRPHLKSGDTVTDAADESDSPGASGGGETHE